MSRYCQSDLMLILVEVSLSVAIRSKTSIILITYVNLHKQSNLLVSQGLNQELFPLDSGHLCLLQWNWFALTCFYKYVPRNLLFAIILLYFYLKSLFCFCEPVSLICCWKCKWFQRSVCKTLQVPALVGGQLQVLGFISVHGAWSFLLYLWTLKLCWTVILGLEAHLSLL